MARGATAQAPAGRGKQLHRLSDHRPIPNYGKLSMVNQLYDLISIIPTYNTRTPTLVKKCFVPKNTIHYILHFHAIVQCTTIFNRRVVVEKVVWGFQKLLCENYIRILPLGLSRTKTSWKSPRKPAEQFNGDYDVSNALYWTTPLALLFWVESSGWLVSTVIEVKLWSEKSNWFSFVWSVKNMYTTHDLNIDTIRACFIFRTLTVQLYFINYWLFDVIEDNYCYKHWTVRLQHPKITTLLQNTYLLLQNTCYIQCALFYIKFAVHYV